MANSKTSKHTTKPSKISKPVYKKPASIGKHASVIGKLGGRPRKDGTQKSY